MSGTTVLDEQAYGELVAKTLPRVIHTEAENERYLAELEALLDRGNLTREEKELSELLTLLIEDFENKRYRLEPACPLEVVKELMAANNLKQVDMMDVFGNRSVASEVLAGKRELSKTHIQRLVARFGVSPELFFP